MIYMHILYIAALLLPANIRVQGLFESLWPLNKYSLATDINAPPSSAVAPIDCSLSYTAGPFGLPDGATILHGDNFIDLPIETVITADQDFTFSGMFLISSPGTLFQFKADNDSTPVFELSMSIIGQELKIHVKTNETEVRQEFGADVSYVNLNTWNHFVVGVDVSHMKVKVQVNDDKVLDVAFAPVLSYVITHVFGVLRVGEDQNETQQNLIGSVACVGFHLGVHKITFSESSTACNVVPGDPIDLSNCSTSLGTRPRDRTGYFLKTSDRDVASLTVIKHTDWSTETQCAYACFMDLNCWFYKLDAPGCYLYDGNINQYLGTGDPDIALYKWYST